MRLPRRTMVGGVASACVLALSATSRHALADDFPSKPIRLIVGFSPGGSADFIARVLGEAVAARLGQNVVIENRPGAVAAIALEYTAKSAPDGYTLTLGSSAATSMLAVEKPHLQYNISKDFTYLSRIVELDYVLVVNAKLPITSLAELVAHAKANPGQLKSGTVGIGSATHLAILLLEQQAGMQIVTVPYKSNMGVLPDLLSGILDIAFMTVQDCGETAKSGRLRALAITSQLREPLLPDVPTMTESGYPGATMTIWTGVLGPAGIPAPVVARLENAITGALDDAVVKQRLANLALRPAPLTGDAFRDSVMNEVKQWKTIVETAHLVVK